MNTEVATLLAQIATVASWLHEHNATPIAGGEAGRMSDADFTKWLGDSHEVYAQAVAQGMQCQGQLYALRMRH